MRKINIQNDIDSRNRIAELNAVIKQEIVEYAESKNIQGPEDNESGPIEEKKKEKGRKAKGDAKEV